MKEQIKSSDSTTATTVKTPSLEKIRESSKVSDCSFEITQRQRKFAGPPPGWEGPAPGPRHELFCGRIPTDVYEDKLIPLFEKYGKLWDLRLMVDGATGLSRGYCFVTYCEKECTQKAVDELNGFEIAPDRRLKVNFSTSNTRLFVGNLPKNKTADQIKEQFTKFSDGLVDVIVYPEVNDISKKNRGFAFLDYESHHDASTAKRRLSMKTFRVWNCDILVDWADPLEDPDDTVMSKVRILYIRNLTASVSENDIRQLFEKYGPLERVRKLKSFAFVHYQNRDDAISAMSELHEKEIGGCCIDVTLAKPPSATHQKRRELRKQEIELRKKLVAAGLDPYAYANGHCISAIEGLLFPSYSNSGHDYRNEDYAVYDKKPALERFINESLYGSYNNTSGSTSAGTVSGASGGPVAAPDDYHQNPFAHQHSRQQQHQAAAAAATPVANPVAAATPGFLNTAHHHPAAAITCPHSAGNYAAGALPTQPQAQLAAAVRAAAAAVSSYQHQQHSIGAPTHTDRHSYTSLGSHSSRTGTSDEAIGSDLSSSTSLLYDRPATAAATGGSCVSATNLQRPCSVDGRYFYGGGATASDLGVAGYPPAYAYSAAALAAHGQWPAYAAHHPAGSGRCYGPADYYSELAAAHLPQPGLPTASAAAAAALGTSSAAAAAAAQAYYDNQRYSSSMAAAAAAHHGLLTTTGGGEYRGGGGYGGYGPTADINRIASYSPSLAAAGVFGRDRLNEWFSRYCAVAGNKHSPPPLLAAAATPEISPLAAPSAAANYYPVAGCHAAAATPLASVSPYGHSVYNTSAAIEAASAFYNPTRFGYLSRNTESV